MDFSDIVGKIMWFLKSEVGERKATGIVVGLSGGLDSSVVAQLAVNALGPDRVLGLVLPESRVTPNDDTRDAKKLAEYLDIKYNVIDIFGAKHLLLKKLPKNRIAQASLASRLRMSLLYYFATETGKLVAGTSDKSELRLGYFTKYGDGAADIFPIADLYKTEVRELAKFLGLPFKIGMKKSRPGLIRGQTAEGELGLKYTQIDSILRRIEPLFQQEPDEKVLQQFHTKIVVEGEFEEKAVSRVVELVGKNLHKLQKPPICLLQN